MIQSFKALWNQAFLAERPSISLSLFRLAAAFTVGAHVIPSLSHLEDNYYAATAFKSVNTNFFPIWFIELVSQSPDWVVNSFVLLFMVAWFFFFIGLFSQVSCILMVLACYYFYALNSFHVGTLSWDILLVTLFLLCITAYPGDYLSLDCLIKGDELAYQSRRPFFLQRLLQLQIGFTFLYTALYKVTKEGNWLIENPMLNIVNAPPPGVTKTFLLRDYMMHEPGLCYALGILIVTIEFLMVFLLFWHKTRIPAIYLGILFHIALILTLDVPATFFFLFPAQLLLFINPEQIVAWIDQRRAFNQNRREKLTPPLILYDGHCQFCCKSIKQLKGLDLFAVLQYVDLHEVEDLSRLHPSLTKERAMSQLHLLEASGTLHGGFDVFRRMSFSMPMLYPLIPVFYFPGMGWAGDLVYRFVAKNRYLFHWNRVCQDNACFIGKKK